MKGDEGSCQLDNAGLPRASTPILEVRQLKMNIADSLHVLSQTQLLAFTLSQSNGGKLFNTLRVHSGFKFLESA